MKRVMQNAYIQLVPADVSFAEQVADYYKRNKEFLEAFEPVRTEEFFSLAYQKEVLRKEMLAYEEKTAFRFYIVLAGLPARIIGIIGLNHVIWGGFPLRFFGVQTGQRLSEQRIYVHGGRNADKICF